MQVIRWGVAWLQSSLQRAADGEDVCFVARVLVGTATRMETDGESRVSLQVGFFWSLVVHCGRLLLLSWKVCV